MFVDKKERKSIAHVCGFVGSPIVGFARGRGKFVPKVKPLAKRKKKKVSLLRSVCRSGCEGDFFAPMCVMPAVDDYFSLQRGPRARQNYRGSE